MDTGRYDYDLPSLISSRMAADGAPSTFQNRNSKKTNDLCLTGFPLAGS
jgi:hypothetical protein